MLLIENLAYRWKEWRDRQEEEPDLVPRLRQVWTAPRFPPAPGTAARTAAFGRGPALNPLPRV
jgi:hypothetical protein